MIVKLGCAKPFFLILLLLLLFLTIISYSVVVHHSKVVPIRGDTISDRMKNAEFSSVVKQNGEHLSSVKQDEIVSEIRKGGEEQSLFGAPADNSTWIGVKSDTVSRDENEETSINRQVTSDQNVRKKMPQVGNSTFKADGSRDSTNSSFKADSMKNSKSLQPSHTHSRRVQNRIPKEIFREDNCASCFYNNFSLVINEASACDKFVDLDLLLLISTGMDRFQERTVVRETWGQLCTVRNKLACLFTLGSGSNANLQKKILAESKQYGDIIQFDFKDSYANLTYKTMSSFRWAADHCPEAKFVMKTDTDMYVNTENLPKMLSEGAPRTNFMGGFCWIDSSPHRNRDSKWYVSFRDYAQPRFPPMCSGTGYILSFDAVNKLLNISRNIPYFHLEDVYVAICMQKLKIKPTNLFGFHNVRVLFDACKYRNALYTSHGIDSYTLRRYWKESRNCTKSKTDSRKLYFPLPLHIP